MAPFNKRQIGYIQAIAGRQQHRTLKCGQVSGQISSKTVPTLAERPQTLHPNKVIGQGQNVPTDGWDDDAKSLLLYSWLLDHVESCYDSQTGHNDNRLTTADVTGLSDVSVGMGKYDPLNVFDAPLKGTQGITVYNPNTTPQQAYVHGDAEGEATGALVRNPELISSIHRATPDGFLNSTDIKFRFTLPRHVDSDAVSGQSNAMGQDHYEFRWIVWRNKRPTLHYASTDDYDHTNLEAIRDGVSFRNPGYDLFMGQTGRKRGFLGYTLNNDLDKDKITTEGEAYSGQRWNGSSFTDSDTMHTGIYPDGEEQFTVDDLLTCRLNKDDYVIMKDVRFFLGKEHGKSHFEDHLHWDWNDPIDTPKDNVLTSTTLNDKNYRWHMTLIGTSGGASECTLNVRALWTTKMESG